MIPKSEVLLMTENTSSEILHFAKLSHFSYACFYINKEYVFPSEGFLVANTLVTYN